MEFLGFVWVHVESLGGTPPRSLCPRVCGLDWDLVRPSSLLSRQRDSCGKEAGLLLQCSGSVSVPIMEPEGSLPSCYPVREGSGVGASRPPGSPACPILGCSAPSPNPYPGQVTAVCFAAGGKSAWRSCVETGVHSNVTTPRCSGVPGLRLGKMGGLQLFWGVGGLSRRDGAW